MASRIDYINLLASARQSYEGSVLTDMLREGRLSDHL